MIAVWRGLIAALQQLTRFPVPSPPVAPDARTLAWAAIFFPVVGAGLGWLAWGVAEASSRLWPREVGALLALGVLALATGALHEDGLADAADAFGSQSTPEGLMRVMKDSRIGTYGAVALLLTYALRWFCLSHLGLAGFLVGQSAPRAGVVTLAGWAGPAGEGGGGAFAAAVSRGVAMATWFCCALFYYPVFREPAVGWSVAACLLFAGVAAGYFKSRLGGVNGDCLGASAVLMECMVLLILLAAPLP
ncbi:MAG: adenosylcobinamide-GDP ribazoletransferase [Bryobacterales bacterium]|nr:adenosylcobinamide-GDP ribazoletransferase [Bryobacterales bacterium]